MRLTLFFIVSLISTSYSQVGVNVPLPIEVFHVDGSKNNSIGIAPTKEQAKDDFIVTKDGNVGLGVLDPQAKLDVNGSIRIVDGTQGANKVMMSNALDQLRWESIPYIVPTVLGEFETGIASSSDVGTSYAYSKGNITLTKGRWIVNMGLTISFPSAQDFWLQAILSSSKTSKVATGFKFNGVAGTNTAYASRMKVTAANNLSLLSGSSVIDVTADSVKIYLLIAKSGTWSFAPSSWENYFYAIPVL